MKRKIATGLGVALLVAVGAKADTFTDAIVTDLQSQGFEFIEIKDGPGVVKVEAVRDGAKLEVVYDRATGRILKQETGPAGGDAGRRGVEIVSVGQDAAVPVSAASMVDVDALVADLEAQGFEYIEVKQGPTQIKVEAIRGDQKVETVYDAASGEVLKQEVEHAGDDAGRSGVSVRSRDDDFADDGGDGSRGHDDDDDDDGDDDRSGQGSDDDRSGPSGGDDGDHDDDRDNDHGDNHDDDHGDDHDDDRGGRGDRDDD
jgi:hypothetical protein